MAINDHRPAAIFRSPVVAHRQAEFVGLAGSFAVEGEVPNPPGCPALHLGTKTGVRHYELAIVEHVVADEPVQKVDHLLFEAGGLLAELPQRLGKSVRYLDVPSLQSPHELLFMISGDAKRRA